MLQRLFPRVYEGWLVVGASAFTVLLIAASFFYGFGTIFNEVVDEFGWSVAATSLAFSLRSEVGGLAAPLVGVMIDRVGPRRVIVVGILASAAGVLLMSLIQEIWHFYAAMVFIALGTSASGGQVGLAAIATWFERYRARAMSLMTLGGGLGGLLVIFVAALVEEFGWRSALRILALIMVTVGVAVGWNIRARPDDYPRPMDGRVFHEADGSESLPVRRWGVPVRQVLRTRAFILMALGMIALSFATTAVVVHQIPYLEREIGVSKAVAGSSMAVFTLTSIVGRLGIGILADRYPKRLMMAGASVLVAIGLPVLALADSYFEVIVAIALIAPGFGGGIPVRPAMLADYFGTKFFGMINGVGALIMTTGGAIGPWAVGRVVDVTGHYTNGWYLATAAALISIPLFLLATPPSALIAEHRAAAALEPGKAEGGA